MATVRERVRELQEHLVAAQRKRLADIVKADATHQRALAKIDATYTNARERFEKEIESLGTRSPDDVLPEPPKRAPAKKED